MNTALWIRRRCNADDHTFFAETDPNLRIFKIKEIDVKIDLTKMKVLTFETE
jgi:hypothetical protein